MCSVSELDQLRSIVSHDVDPEFLEAVAIAIGWEYFGLYEELASGRGLTEAMRVEEFARRRGFCVAKALATAAARFRIPVEHRRLNCNGQNKTIVQAGRVLLIQEPINSLTDKPKIADYKAGMADVHGLVRQLELDLGDRPYVARDWSGCIMGVLLHGAVGPKFTLEHRRLGGLFLAVPDASYSQWVIRLDLHDLAMFGRDETTVATPVDDPASAVQPDLVVVTRKKKVSRGAG